MVTIENIDAKNSHLLKMVRLRALQESPTAFGSTYAEESQLSDADWIDRASQCSNNMSVGYLAMDEAMPRGIIRATRDDKDSSIAWVESMWIDTSYRRHRVGTLLMNSVVAWARSQRIQVLKLEVTSNNGPAICFYESVGFAQTGNTKPYPNDPRLLEYEMSRVFLNV
jgi:ribosomal protein S18 acetylase RimI-like enzyme